MFLPKRGAAADLIVIGASEEITGVYAEPARNEIRGMQLAVDQINKAGGVLSRQVKLVIEDNANNPGTAVEKARKLIQVDKINALIGTVNSANSQATSNVCLEATIPFVDTGGHTDSVTGQQCHWTSFRTCHSTWMETHATGYSIANKLGKKWYYLAPDYAFGHSLLDGYKDIEKKLGVTVVGEDLAPLGTTDFSAYLTKVLNAKPDVLIIMQQGQDLINCLKQANSLGLLKRIAVAGPQGEIENFWSLPKEARVGYWGFEWYYKSALVTGKNKAAADFIKTYTDLYKQPPTARSGRFRSTTSNTNSPPCSLTRIRSPGTRSLRRMRCARGFSICCWMARLSGRAPYTGSNPAAPIRSRAASSSSSSMLRSSSRRRRASS